MPIFDRVQLGIDRDRATSQRINNKRKELGLSQAELARRQGASIRAMKHAGIERGGYKSPWLAVTQAVRRLWRRDGESPEAIVAADIS